MGDSALLNFELNHRTNRAEVEAMLFPCIMVSGRKEVELLKLTIDIFKPSSGLPLHPFPLNNTMKIIEPRKGYFSIIARIYLHMLISL